MAKVEKVLVRCTHCGNEEESCVTFDEPSNYDTLQVGEIDDKCDSCGKPFTYGKGGMKIVLADGTVHHDYEN